MSDAPGSSNGPDFTKRPSQPPPPSAQPPHGAPQYGAPQYGARSGVVPLRPDEERTWGTLAHAGGFLVGFISPLIVWLVYRERSVWVEGCAKEALNFQISYTIYLIVSAFSMLALVGFLLFPTVLVAYFVFMIVGIVKAASLQPYRFPLILRLVS